MPKTTSFLPLLLEEVPKKLSNNYQDNIDRYRYPDYSQPLKSKLRLFLTQIIAKGFKNSPFFKWLSLYPIFPYLSKLASFYELLADDNSKEELLQLSLYRALGPTKVKLPINNNKYWEGVHSYEALREDNNRIKIEVIDRELYFHDLSSFSIPVSFYLDSKAAFTTFFLNQYEYSYNDFLIGAEENDTVLDFGACFGDTALFFADKVGPLGKVYSFEFIPNNIRIFKKNLELNPSLKDQIELVEQPVWQDPDQLIFYKDKATGSKVAFEDFNEKDGEVETVSIDQFCRDNSVDPSFIKMDIEGAELFALKGGRDTLVRCKPKLGISIYHSMDDLVGIVAYLDDLNLGYSFYLKHNTIHKEETVLFAIVQ